MKLEKFSEVSGQIVVSPLTVAECSLDKGNVYKIRLVHKLKGFMVDVVFNPAISETKALEWSKAYQLEEKTKKEDAE